MLESGIVSLKNEVNIMMKNVVDVVLGGMTYWAFGYGLSYGESEYSNSFIAFGTWFVDASGPEMGATFVTFLFQVLFLVSNSASVQYLTFSSPVVIR
jgi:ammonia channel protein AmtB